MSFTLPSFTPSFTTMVPRQPTPVVAAPVSVVPTYTPPVAGPMQTEADHGTELMNNVRIHKELFPQNIHIPQHTTVLSKAMNVITATPMDRKKKKKKKRTRKKSFKINAINKYKAGIKTSSNKPVGIQQLGEGGLNV